MRVNIYNEELTDRVTIRHKTAEGIDYVGVRFYLALPATVDGKNYKGPFMHQKNDDDSAAVTFWTTDKSRLRQLMQQAVLALDAPEPATHS